MPKIAIFTDFDGTLTCREGLKTVNSDFYNSLFYIQQGQLILKPTKEIQALFVDKFGKYTTGFDYKKKDSDILLSLQALTFLTELLKSEHVAINIITKNCKEYVVALLSYHGFTNEDIARIIIKDSGDKYKDVKAIKNEMKPIEGQILAYVFDDNKNDMSRMNKALHGTHFQVKTYAKSPRQFKWSDYLEEIKAKLSSEERCISEVDEKSLSDTAGRSSRFFSELSIVDKINADQGEKQNRTLGNT